ncbi:hypothetical protein [Vallitalea okinawensis]|nr:hypothetical protein [Vallitalea okinawensis]
MISVHLLGKHKDMDKMYALAQVVELQVNYELKFKSEWIDTISI